VINDTTIQFGPSVAGSITSPTGILYTGTHVLGDTTMTYATAAGTLVFPRIKSAYNILYDFYSCNSKLQGIFIPTRVFLPVFLFLTNFHCAAIIFAH